MADVIARLKLESGEFDSKIKRAVSGLMQMEAECRKVGGTLAVLEKDQLDYVKSLGNMETVSRTARGRISELSNAYVELAVQYRRLTDEEKKGDYGKALNSSLAQLKGRLNDAKKELAEVEGEMKGASAAGVDFNSVLASLGQRLGINSELMGVLNSGTLATTAAVTAGAAAVAAATKMWADYNDELNRQTNVTTVTTGLKGGDAENLTMGVRALARTYDVDFREAINAANTLIQQFGVTGTEALKLLQDGMQGMIAGDGQKMLNMLQQFAPAFVDAGISASQLVAIIHNSEGGLFSDQNMNAILMGIKNIRLMTKQTSDALAQLGIDGAEMTRKMEDGSMTVFEALHKVSEAIEGTSSSSQAAGQVMQSVFGRQGAMQGMKLGRAIAELNTNLEETKKQTGELGDSFARLNEANLELEQTMQEIFGMNGWEDMNNFLKTELANTLTFTLEFLINIRDTLKSIGSYASDTWNDFVGRFTGEAYKPKENSRTNAQNQNPTAQWQWRIPGFGGYTPRPMQPARPTQQQPQNSYQVVTSGGKVVRESRVVNGQKVDEPKQTNQRTYEQVKADLDRAKKEMENAKESFSKGTAKSLVDYYEQELKGLPKPDVKPKTTNTKSTSTTTKKETWAPIEMADLTLGTQKVQKVVEVTVDDAAALEQIREIDGVTIADKGMTITATDEALPKLREIEGVTIADKGMTITATDEALPKLREIEGVTIADKGMTITATDEALPKLREIEGVKLSDKVIDVVVNDNSDFLFGRSRQDVQKDLQRAQKAYDIAPDEWTRAEARKDVTRYQKELETMNGEGDVTKGLLKDAYTHDFGKDMDALSKELKNEQKTTQLSETEQVKQMGAMVGGIQQMVGGIAQLGIEIPEGFQSLLGGMQGIMTILQAIQTIQTVGSVLGLFRNGGIVPHAATGLMVPGNDFSDSTPVMVSSGELILNKAQQNAVAQGLQEERGRGDYSSTPYVDGEKIYLGMNNFLRRSGRGEIVTSRR